jgi:NADPH-dependent curcumin reductase CurA
MISQYNDTEPPPGPRNLALLIGKRLRVEGFLVDDHRDLRPDFVREVGGWVRDGSLRYRETVTEGIENGVEAFLAMMRGDSEGKAVVHLAGE